MVATAEYRSDPNIGEPIGSASIHQQMQHFRQVFTELGFQEQPVAGYLKFTGQFNGRRVMLTAGTRQKTRYLTPEISRRVHAGTLFSIRMDTNIRTRLFFCSADSTASWLISFLQKRRGNTCLTGLEANYPGLNIWASEPSWAKSFLCQADVNENLRALLYSDAERFNSVHWMPGFSDFTPWRSLSNLSAELLTQLMKQHEALITAAERQPPKLEAELSWLERKTEKANPTFLVMLFLLTISALLIIVLAVPALILIFLLTTFA